MVDSIERAAGIKAGIAKNGVTDARRFTNMASRGYVPSAGSSRKWVLDRPEPFQPSTKLFVAHSKPTTC